MRANRHIAASRATILHYSTVSALIALLIGALAYLWWPGSHSDAQQAQLLARCAQRQSVGIERDVIQCTEDFKFWQDFWRERKPQIDDHNF